MATLRAARLFSQRRAADAAALVTISRNLDRPGKWFYVTFLIPLILDGIFHKMAPRLFGPNIFGMFQRQDLTFWQIQRKKRLDRCWQVSILSAALAGTVWGVRYALLLLLLLGKPGRVVTATTLGFAAVAALVAVRLRRPKAIHPKNKDAATP